MTTLACARCKQEFNADRLEGKFGGLCPRCVFRSVVGDGDLAAVPEGVQFGNYLLLGVLGTGGMGIVYKARQKGLDRMVALKILPGGKDAPAEMVERFFREARAAANLQHPNIVPIHEVAGHEGAYYYSMDLVDGRSFSEILQDRNAPIRDTLEILCKVARAVHYAHERGVIHRDLKPANIMVDRAGEPKVLDFGVAKVLSTQSLATTQGSVLGTPPYMSPEQAAGAKDLDPRTDVYSLGAILYEALTGRPPYTGESAMEVYRKIATDRPVPPTKVNPKTPRALETICLKALAKDRANRYASAQSFADDLRRYLDGKTIEAHPARAKSALPRVAIAVLFLAIVTAGITWFVLEVRTSRRRQQSLASDVPPRATRQETEALLATLGPLMKKEMARVLAKERMTFENLNRLADLSLAYQALCGKIPMDAEDRESIRRAALELCSTPPPSPELLNALMVPDAPRIGSYDYELVRHVNVYLDMKYWLEAAYVDVRKVWEQSWRTQYPDQGQNVFSDAAGSDRLKASHTVPGFFSQACFHGYIQPQFKEHAKNIAWKYEKARIEGAAKDVEDYLYDLYKGEYAGEWNRFLEQIEVLSFGNVEGARDSLQALSGAASTNPAIAKIITEVWNRRIITIDGTAWNVPKRGTEWLKLANDKLMALAKTVDDFVKKTGEGQRFRDYVDNKGKVRDKVDLAETFNTSLSDLGAIVEKGPEQSLLIGVVRRAHEALAQEAREEINRYWSETALAHFKHTLAGKYPLVRTAEADATIQDFNDFFKPETGLLDKTAYYLKTLNDVIVNEKPLVKYTPEYEAAFAYTQRMQAILYSLNKHTVSTKFAIAATSPQEYGHIQLKVAKEEADMKSLIGLRLSEATWEAGQSVFLVLKAEARPNKVLYKDKPGTCWGLFRLCDSGQIKDKGTGSDFQMSWEYLPSVPRLVMTLTCDDKHNPFAPDFFSKFKCPEQVAGE